MVRPHVSSGSDVLCWFYDKIIFELTWLDRQRLVKKMLLKYPTASIVFMQEPQHLRIYWIDIRLHTSLLIMMSSKGNIFHLTGPWWRNPLVTNGPSQRPVTRSFDSFFDLHLNSWANNLRCHFNHYDCSVVCVKNWASYINHIVMPSRQQPFKPAIWVLNNWEWISNFILHVIMDVIT